MKKEDEVELRCPHCKSEEFERILSASGYCINNGSGNGEGARAQTRNCPSGSCTTYEIPGPDG